MNTRVKCPRCGSMNVVRSRSDSFFMYVIIGLLFLFGYVVGALILVVAQFIMHRMEKSTELREWAWECKTCDYKFNTPPLRVNVVNRGYYSTEDSRLKRSKEQSL